MPRCADAQLTAHQHTLNLGINLLEVDKKIPMPICHAFKWVSDCHSSKLNVK